MSSGFFPFGQSDVYLKLGGFIFDSASVNSSAVCIDQGILLVILSRKILNVSHSLYLNWVTAPLINIVRWKPSVSSAPEAQGKKKNRTNRHYI